MKKRNNLDERQEQILLKIEHNGCWFAFWALLAALIVQQFIFGSDFRYIIGEWIVFMALAIYLCVACLRNGIWDRRISPTGKTNLLVSVIAAVIFGVVMFAFTYFRFPGKIQGSIAAGVISGVAVFVICFLVLQVMLASFRKKQRKLEEEPEEEELQ